MTIEQIAQVAHELNRAYCQAIGDNTQPSWEDAPQWQKDSAITGVQFHLVNPDATPENSHESWLKQKTEDGWKYGPVKNPETKEHPCFVPYSELPAEQRAKDYIFRQTIHSLGAHKPSTKALQVMNEGFNPGGRQDVAEIKTKCAELYTLIEKYVPADERSERGLLASIAKTELETAQMYAVKAVTRN